MCVQIISFLKELEHCSDAADRRRDLWTEDTKRAGYERHAHEGGGQLR